MFDDAGHLAFSDLCAIGGGDANLIVLAEAAGLDESGVTTGVTVTSK